MGLQFLYTPFGETWVEEASTVDISHITRFFTNQQYDKESGLYYYNARYYDPHLGSFITPDPAMDGLNHYNYCFSNPVRYTDPTGLYGDYSDASSPPTQYDDGSTSYSPRYSSNSSNGNSSSGGSSETRKQKRQQRKEARQARIKAAEDKFNSWVYANCSNKWHGALKNGYNGPFNYRGKQKTRDEIIDIMGYTDIPKSNDIKGVQISLGYTHASSSGFNIPGAYHTFVIVTNPKNGQQYITRAGPGGEGGGLIFGSILAWSGAWNNSSPYDKPKNTINFQYMGTVNLSFNKVVSKMIEYGDLINSNQIGYKPLTRNSNSYAFTFVESLGFQRPIPIMNAPGHKTDLFYYIK